MIDERELDAWLRLQGKSIKWLQERRGLVRRAWDGGSFPEHKLERVLRRHLKQDPVFVNQLRELRPDWFHRKSQMPSDPPRVVLGQLRFPGREFEDVCMACLTGRELTYKPPDRKDATRGQ